MNRSLYRGRDSSGRWISERVKGGSLLTVEESINPKLQKGGKIIKDQHGQWAHPGKPTQIKGEDITMKGVPYKVKAVTDKGQTAVMEPGKDYKFPGAKYVNEFPEMKSGGQFSMGSAAGPNTDPTYFFKWNFGNVKQPKKASQSRNSLASLGNLNTQVLINKLPQFEQGGSTTMTMGNTKKNKNDIFKRGVGISKLYPFPFKKGGKIMQLGGPLGETPKAIQKNRLINLSGSERVGDSTVVTKNTPGRIQYGPVINHMLDNDFETINVGSVRYPDGRIDSVSPLSGIHRANGKSSGTYNLYGEPARFDKFGNQTASLEPKLGISSPKSPVMQGKPMVAGSGVTGMRKRR